ncbi:MAG: hypothetical protein J5554_03405 [Paludibacteraceae bacterium]|nr:hypothetical protein [Paludibacteraceae bacterium]
MRCGCRGTVQSEGHRAGILIERSKRFVHLHDTQASSLIPRRDRQPTAPAVQSVTNRAGFQPV